MSRVCELTGKRPTTGNRVSHANNKKRRRFLPNLHTQRFRLEGEKRWVSLRVSTNALRTIEKNGLDAVVADLSFISLTLVIPALVRVCTPGAVLVLLVKPQFEAGKAEVDRGSGVIRDPEVWLTVLEAVDVSVRGHAAAIMEGMPSPITGADGNVEFLVHVRAGTVGAPLDATGLVAEVLRSREQAVDR